MTKTYAAKSSAARAARKALAADPEAIGFNVATALGGGWTFGLQYEPATIIEPEAAEEITLTAKEYAVLTTICSHEGAASAQHDLGETWTDASDIAKATGFSGHAVNSLIGSLLQKGLIYSDECGGAYGNETVQCISEEGCRWLLSNEPQEIEEATDEEPGAELDMTDPNGAFKVMMEENGYNQPRQLCKALRATAVEWTGSHKEFKAAAEALGLNPANASAEYYAGRKAAK